MTRKGGRPYNRAAMAIPALRPVPEQRDSTALPRRRAFVVQLADDAAPAEGRLRGRAVHIPTGEAAAFESPDELFLFLSAAIANAEREETTPFPSTGKNSS